MPVMIPTMTALGAALWGLSSLLGLGVIVAYVVWRSWQSAHHTKQSAQQGRQPIAGVTEEARHGEEIHP